uniref:DUF4773 domain-containing protein n=2 Tax=Lygus hesperus TaxID=30085 RepID=A0A0A9XBM4_LYGHE
MKVSLGLLLLVSASYAAQVNVNTPQGISELEKQVKTAPFVDVDPEFDDGATRSWNPITWFKNKFRNKCKCEGSKCGCCFKLKLLENVVCLNTETVSSDQELSVNFKMDDKVLVDKRINLKRTDNVCGTLPPPYNLLKFCFEQQSKVEADGAITTCSNVSFIVGNSVGAAVNFKCLQLKNRKLSFPGGYSEVEKSGMLTLKAKNPFRAALPLFKGKKSLSE